MSECNIKHFSLNDREAIAKVMCEVFTSIGQNWDDTSSLAYVTEYFDKPCNFAAKLDGKVVGFVIAAHHCDHVFVDAIGVLPSHMGQGIGKQLWQKVEEYCRQHQVAEIKMIADPTSQAYQWYARLGLIETGWVELAMKVS